MEIRARYKLIGLFTLAVISAGFAFIYWLSVAGGLEQRALYRIRYDSPVSGLLKGSAVLFNGIRVGEVTALRLDPAYPSDVTVEIAIERRAPVRADTRVGIEFQGLTGAPVVSLVGGTPALPLLASKTREPPALTAEKNAGIGMTQTARDVLRHIDAVVSDNAEPLRNVIANIDKFAGALSRNTDRVDGIMAGLERLTGGAAKATPRIYELAAANVFPGMKKRPTAQILVLEPTALSIFDSEKILIPQIEGGNGPALGPAQWPDILPKVIQARVVQSFENAQVTRAIGRAPEGTRGDFQLLIDIRNFQVNFQVSGDETATAEVELAAKIVSVDGRIVDARTFRATMPAATADVEISAKALSNAFAKVASDIVVWKIGRASCRERVCNGV